MAQFNCRDFAATCGLAVAEKDFYAVTKRFREEPKTIQAFTFP